MSSIETALQDISDSMLATMRNYTAPIVDKSMPHVAERANFITNTVSLTIPKTSHERTRLISASKLKAAQKLQELTSPEKEDLAHSKLQMHARAFSSNPLLQNASSRSPYESKRYLPVSPSAKLSSSPSKVSNRSDLSTPSNPMHTRNLASSPQIQNPSFSPSPRKNSSIGQTSSPQLYRSQQPPQITQFRNTPMYSTLMYESNPSLVSTTTSNDLQNGDTQRRQASSSPLQRDFAVEEAMYSSRLSNLFTNTSMTQMSKSIDTASLQTNEVQTPSFPKSVSTSTPSATQASFNNPCERTQANVSAFSEPDRHSTYSDDTEASDPMMELLNEWGVVESIQESVSNGLRQLAETHSDLSFEGAAHEFSMQFAATFSDQLLLALRQKGLLQVEADEESHLDVRQAKSPEKSDLDINVSAVSLPTDINKRIESSFGSSHNRTASQQELLESLFTTSALTSARITAALQQLVLTQLFGEQRDDVNTHIRKLEEKQAALDRGANSTKEVVRKLETKTRELEEIVAPKISEVHHHHHHHHHPPPITTQFAPYTTVPAPYTIPIQHKPVVDTVHATTTAKGVSSMPNLTAATPLRVVVPAASPAAPITVPSTFPTTASATNAELPVVHIRKKKNRTIFSTPLTISTASDASSAPVPQKSIHIPIVAKDPVPPLPIAPSRDFAVASHPTIAVRRRKGEELEAFQPLPGPPAVEASVAQPENVDNLALVIKDMWKNMLDFMGDKLESAKPSTRLVPGAPLYASSGTIEQQSSDMVCAADATSMIAIEGGASEPPGSPSINGGLEADRTGTTAVELLTLTARSVASADDTLSGGATSPETSITTLSGPEEFVEHAPQELSLAMPPESADVNSQSLQSTPTSVGASPTPRAELPNQEESDGFVEQASMLSPVAAETPQGALSDNLLLSLLMNALVQSIREENLRSSSSLRHHVDNLDAKVQALSTTLDVVSKEHLQVIARVEEADSRTKSNMAEIAQYFETRTDLLQQQSNHLHMQIVEEKEAREELRADVQNSVETLANALVAVKTEADNAMKEINKLPTMEFINDMKSSIEQAVLTGFQSHTMEIGDLKAAYGMVEAVLTKLILKLGENEISVKELNEVVGIDLWKGKLTKASGVEMPKPMPSPGDAELPAPIPLAPEDEQGSTGRIQYGLGQVGIESQESPANPIDTSNDNVEPIATGERIEAEMTVEVEPKSPSSNMARAKGPGFENLFTIQDTTSQESDIESIASSEGTIVETASEDVSMNRAAEEVIEIDNVSEVPRTTLLPHEAVEAGPLLSQTASLFKHMRALQEQIESLQSKLTVLEEKPTLPDDAVAKLEQVLEETSRRRPEDTSGLSSSAESTPSDTFSSYSSDFSSESSVHGYVAVPLPVFRESTMPTKVIKVFEESMDTYGEQTTIQSELPFQEPFVDYDTTLFPNKEGNTNHSSLNGVDPQVLMTLAANSLRTLKKSLAQTKRVGRTRDINVPSRKSTLSAHDVTFSTNIHDISSISVPDMFNTTAQSKASMGRRFVDLSEGELIIAPDEHGYEYSVSDGDQIALVHVNH